MAADVKSIAALEDWKVHLVNFRTDGLESITALHLEVQKALSWLEDTEAYWKRMVRQTEEELVEAKAELARREMPDFSGKTPDTTLHKKAVQKCKAKLEYCHDQIDLCRSWRTKLPRMVGEEFEGPARRFTNFIETELARGITVLDKQISALESYANMGQVPAAAPAAKPEGT
ncbi:hypothetical protein KIH39_14595 [Telmatocola sphagniphila]|uniref:Uncharacterized protein n=1 Tax=Telmatocola sphagniphila TaxID=1123043 RepID=A0A8E6B1I0_9BACT|nr:hypothetical protein [Telmatocola sphagniphila]QVL30088.1 hypothetical protein KIH39_14595 [Telmatocola sphagniphila]